jgi:hypothetical protein
VADRKHEGHGLAEDLKYAGQVTLTWHNHGTAEVVVKRTNWKVIIIIIHHLILTQGSGFEPDKQREGKGREEDV